jgi:hypothetical protein
MRHRRMPPYAFSPVGDPGGLRPSRPESGLADYKEAFPSRSSKGHLAVTFSLPWHLLDVSSRRLTPRNSPVPLWTEQAHLRSSPSIAGAMTRSNRQSLGGDSTVGSFTPLSNWRTGRRGSPSGVRSVDSPAPGPWVYRGGICWEPTDPKGADDAGLGRPDANDQPKGWS